MTFAHVYNKIHNEDRQENTKSYIIKKQSNNKILFVQFIFNSTQFKLVTTGSQLHGAGWPWFNCVQMIQTMSLAAAVVKKDGKVWPWKSLENSGQFFSPSLVYLYFPKWCGGVTVKHLGLRSVGRRFKSCSRQRCVTTLGKLFTPMCLCHQAV